MFAILISDNSQRADGSRLWLSSFKIALAKLHNSMQEFCSRHSAKALVFSYLSCSVDFSGGKATTTSSPYFGWPVHANEIDGGFKGPVVLRLFAQELEQPADLC